MIAETIPQLNALTADQKIILAAELMRDAIGEDTEEPDPAMVAALQERLDYYNAHPDEVYTWEEVKARLVARTRK